MPVQPSHRAWVNSILNLEEGVEGKGRVEGEKRDLRLSVEEQELEVLEAAQQGAELLAIGQEAQGAGSRGGTRAAGTS